MDLVYKVKDASGRMKEAVAQAESPTALRAKLTASGMQVVEIRPRSGMQAARLKTSLSSYLALLEQVKLKDMVVFSRQFSAMVGSGVAMLRTLTIMVDQCENKKMKRTLDSVRRAVESGVSLSDALARHPDVFDKLYVAMVRAGEIGGILDDVLKRLADFLESKHKLNQKVQSAMVYPSVVLAVAVIVFWGMLTFILPVFQGLFKNVGGELPAYTQFLVNLSQFMRSIWMMVFVVFVIAVTWAIGAWYKTDVGKLQIDTLLLRLPVFGDLIKKVAIARFSRTFGTLVRSGVPMLSSLDVVKDTAGNAVLGLSVEAIHQEVRQGGNISKPLTKDSLFPPMVTQMVAEGEETGRLDEMLGKIADFYDMEVENAVDALTSILEPIMVVGIGGIVGSVVVGMYLPIFTVINQIR
ncbi:MAG: type II secretion system F family protein [Candidatus Melainabacteria bacterium]|nr:type II secretion system F family protein [Candidatus Melainabacteria bacterium]